ncbi:UNVERIFIED_CONTAM: hypothetical protein PYX00_007794 [Menopon gallinae]
MRIGTGPSPYRDMVWGRHNQMIPEDGPDQAYQPFVMPRTGRFYPTTPEYLPRYPECERIRQPVPRSRGDYSEPWSQPHARGRSAEMGSYEDAYSFRPLDTRSEQFDEFASEDGRKGFETALHRKLVLGDRPKNVASEEGVMNDPLVYYQSLGRLPHSRAVSPHRKEEITKPMMTEHPVEMKKPEFIVGKLHPEATSRFEYFGQSAEHPEGDGRRVSPSYEGEGRLQETPPSEVVSQPSPQAKWTLLKHKKTIDKLKETLSFEEELEKIESSKPIRSRTPSPNKLRDAEKFQESPRISPKNVIPEVSVTAETVDGQPRPEELAPQDGHEQKSEEIFEDNEESYPESYYEQPPKPDYSRSIASNVILEEDESEMVANEEAEMTAEVAPPTSTDGYDQPYETNPPRENGQFDMYSAEYKPEAVGESESQYHMAEYAEGEMYGTESQGEYVYQNQEIAEYGPGSEYGTAEETANSQQYYAAQQGEDYNSEVQAEYEGQYQSQQFQQYGDDAPYQQEYAQDQASEYYDQDGYHEGYYQGQVQQGGEYPPDEQQQQNMAYSESSGVEIAQPENTYPEGVNNLPLRQSNLAQLLESDSESFQMEHGSPAGNEDSDFDFSMSQQQ